MRVKALSLAVMASTLLTACTMWQASQEGPPAWMEQDCGVLPKMQKGKAQQSRVEATMNKDAVAFKTCRARHRALRDWYRVRDGRK